MADATNTSLALLLLPSFGVDDLWHAVRMLDGMNETFNQSYSALELLVLVRACRLSEWDVTPDLWTDEQIAKALVDGMPPYCETEVPDGSR